MNASGSVMVVARLEGRVAMSRVTEGWTDGECAALRAGDAEAREQAEIRATRLLVLDHGIGGFDVEHSSFDFTPEAAA